ncbi:hypothetical protein BO83DRAFT_185491 [Aspergillus eucalypticola CBS 122712]|uniref:Extracellular membrane protein CFEM domain-containing protein n=1 Tax=Aspergillus eucalypticola (strain CBS 122712 / IBT 29274) TaxID=1448314 RepID=A0A317URD2_ASPEC|nr:uncharacterized protein BO83DRAFT_185491 [Aspergillus eucalypticola CBS 122712]PWY62600.1 hypothetical protein BO83DRAFT_185491 [Aspergillus eucalypticola CBS 122712]
MKVLSFILTTLAITTGALAAPEPGTAAAESRNWDWCATSFSCDSDDDCMNQYDCKDKSKSWTFEQQRANIGCGASVYPHSCYYEYDY